MRAALLHYSVFDRHRQRWIGLSGELFGIMRKLGIRDSGAQEELLHLLIENDLEFMPGPRFIYKLEFR